MNGRAPSEVELQRQGFGSILSRAPLITVGKRSHFHASPVGIGPLACAVHPGGPSLHFVFLAWSHESDEAAQSCARDVAAAFSPFPSAKVVMLANTAAEAQALQRAGLEAEVVNQLLAVDENRFVPVRPDADFPSCTAVYVAGLEPYKRHDLAVEVQGLRLLYWQPSASNLAETRKLLPEADFANHRIGGGPHVLAIGARYCAAVQSARVGLCLSDTEGPMRASIEYGLLGLPVVTTSALGGRLEFLDPAHSRIVPFQADAVATAVEELARNRAAPEVVRAATLARLAQERARFARVAEAWAKRMFGAAGEDVLGCDPRGLGLWRTRTLAEILDSF